MVQARERCPFLCWLRMVLCGGSEEFWWSIRSLELIWARGERFLKVSRREFVVGVEVDKFVRALSELYQEQMVHVPGLRVVVEGSW